MNYESKSNKHYYWAVMPDIYIATALILCKEMKVNNLSGCGGVIKGLKLRSAHLDEELVLPLVFNFKLGVELYIKSLGIIDYGKYKKTHDLKLLLNELLISVKKTKNEKAIGRLYKDTWPIIKKYYYGRYIPSKKGSNFADKRNEAERYPEYYGKKIKKNLRPIYKIPDSSRWVTDELIKNIEKDIRSIEKFFAQAKRDIKPTKKFIYGKIEK